ncbi:MAG: L,D-transpeptidase, partial [Waddliaceae bacterium]
MSFQRILLLMIVVLFGSIGVIAFTKRGKNEPTQQVVEVLSEPIEIELPSEEQIAVNEITPEPPAVIQEERQVEPPEVVNVSDADLPDADRVEEFFNKRDPKLAIVQTITYKSRVPWLKGRPAWIADYSSHFKTSRHFIARSLNGKPDYEKQDVVDGDRFNVFREDKNFEFYLLIDTLTSKMWFYYYDIDTKERVLVKTYKVGLGRPDASSESGTLTPLGKYTLGSKIAVYRPKTMAFHQGEKTEMVRIFGTRWIPFGEEVSGCTAPPKGYGLHGLPLLPNDKGDLVENLEILGRFESDGCIRMATKDIEELFAIIITKPAVV